MLLEADTPGEWLDTHLAAWFAYYDPDVEHAAYTASGLAGGGVAALYGQLASTGTPGKAAAKYLAAWYGGLVARSVGYVALAADAVPVVGDGLRWLAHPDGWAAKLELGEPELLVAPGHPWAGHATVVADPGERAERAVAALARAVAPLLEALRALAGLGMPGLWAEVGDGFGGVLAYQGAIPVTEGRIGALRELAEAPGAPWRTRLELWRAGELCIMRKGGCCRAYTEPQAPGYCGDCSLRDRGSCEAMQTEYAAAQR